MSLDRTTQSKVIIKTIFNCFGAPTKQKQSKTKQRDKDLEIWKLGKTETKTCKQKQIRVSGQEYACAYIGHACESQLYAYAYFEYVYSCKEHAYAYTPETLT